MFTSYSPAKDLYEASERALAVLEKVAPDSAETQALSKAFDGVRGAIEEAEAHKADIERAREIYATDECEIDDYPVVSVSDKGLFVSAWVWVPREEPVGEEGG